jgi:phage tail-like protein
VKLGDLPDEVMSRLNIFGLEKLRAYSFFVQIDSPPRYTGSQVIESLLGFSELSGIGESLRVKIVEEGGNPRQHKFPRMKESPDLIMRRGMTLSRSFYDWYQEAANWTKGKSDYRRTMSIYIVDYSNPALIAPSGSKIDIAIFPYEAWRFDVYGAWPSNWSGPALKADEENMAFESITIQHSGLSEAKGLFSGRTGDILSILQ